MGSEYSYIDMSLHEFATHVLNIMVYKCMRMDTNNG